MPKPKTPQISSLLGKTVTLSSAMRPKKLPLDAETLRQHEETRKVIQLFRVRNGYSRQKWPWGAAAEYLYRVLIRALDLEHVEDELLRLAKPKPGRKAEQKLAARILSLKAEGKTARLIREIFEAEGSHFSQEKIESYLKTRRKKRPSF
jgi:hypothetical protein